MTDIIERLRIESRREPHEPIWRDAIDEIEALRVEVAVQRTRADAMAREAIKHEARAEWLAEALRPLAELDLTPDDFDQRPNSQPIYARNNTVITVGDVRKARAALDPTA